MVHGIIPVVFVDGGKSVILTADDILQGERIAVAVSFERVGQRKLACGLAFLPKVHQQFVLDTFGGIGRQPDVFVRTEGADRFDQSDCSKRDQVILLGAGCVVFLHNMRHQAQVVFDELFAGLFVVFLLHFSQQFSLLFRCERLGKAAVDALHAQDKEKKRATERK